MRNLLLLFFGCLGFSSFAYSYSFPYILHSRVDTFDQNVKEIATLWGDYLDSRPDSLKKNPFWNEAEQNQYTDFDFTRQFLYPMPSPSLLAYYSPTVLSIVPAGKYYAIRTLFAANCMEDAYQHSNPWCITRIFAERENGKWKLKNALPVLTEYWEKRRVGKITYVFPASHQFDAEKAQQAANFYEELPRLFNFPEPEPFTYYLTQSMDEMGALLGFDFYYSGATTGMAMPDRKMLFAGNGSEWYPHELTHMLVPNIKRHALINEGFATYVAGANHCNTLEEGAMKLLADLQKEPNTSIDDILSLRWRKQYSTYYVLGGLLCAKVHQQKGIEGLHALLKIPPTDEALHAHLAKFFGLSDRAWSHFLKMGIGHYL